MRISDWSSDVCSSDLHHQSGDDEGAIGNVADLGHPAADRRAEDDEIERGGDHRHQQAGPEGAAKARHFERIDGADTANVRDHAARSSPFGSRTNPTKIRSEEHTSELQSLMRISYAVFCLKKKKTQPKHT